MRRAVLMAVALLTTLAHADTATPRRPRPDTPDRVYDAATLSTLPGGGLIANGSATLRIREAGARDFTPVHRQPGDDLYRLAVSDTGGVLAAWEKDPLIHYFTPAPRRHSSFPKPTAPHPEIGYFNVRYLAFLPNGRDALVQMHGSWRPYNRRSFNATYRIALDGRSPPELLYQVNNGFWLDMTRDFAVYVMPEKPEQDCDNRTCDPVASVEVYELTPEGVKRTVLVDGRQTPLSNARMIWGSGDDLLVLRLSLPRNQQALLRWRRGDPSARIQPMPGRISGGAEYFATPTGEVLVTDGDEGAGLSIRRFLPDGSEKLTRLPGTTDPESWDRTVYDVGVRSNGQLWMHWGDNLLLFPRGLDKAPVAIPLEPLLERKTEWAGATVYLARPESLWIGLDGRVRSFARVDLTLADKRARPWPLGPPARAGRGAP